MRVCFIYDCLYPYTVGGAERWYRSLAERLAARGDAVTYLTRPQWEDGHRPEVAGVRVVGVGPRSTLYTSGGRRRIGPPLAFGAAVSRHLLRHGDEYDVVHTASFPYFSLLAAGALRRRAGFRLFVDWHELWTREYWREYLGPVGGRVGWEVQRACLRVPHHAFCFSRLHEQRLRGAGLTDVMRLEGQYTGPTEVPEPRAVEPVVVFAGRHIREKRVTAVVPAIARARERLPMLRAEILGDGPEHSAVVAQITAYGLRGTVVAPGFVDREILESALSRALCLLLPSRREGYGAVVVESAARGVPAIVARGLDNAAVELVEDGINGAVAPTASADDLATAIFRIHEGGLELRRSTADWFRANAARLSLDASLERILQAYADA